MGEVTILLLLLPLAEPFASVLYLAAVILGTNVRKQMQRYMVNNVMAIVSSV
jgi:hypothetical protein